MFAAGKNTQRKSASEAPLARSRGRRRGKRIHGSAWKVAYADLVTAMMALFIVLWVLNQGRPIREAVSGYFTDPGSTYAATPAAGNASPHAAVPSIPDDRAFREEQKRRLKETGAKLLSELAEVNEFADIMNQIKIEIVGEGLRIEILEAANDVFFKIGDSQLKPTATSLLEKIGGRLKDLPNDIILEGHTDSRPYPGRLLNYTNFELSADRANSARRALIHGGIQVDKIKEVRGYADSLLRDSNDPYNVVNRRISILVRYTRQPE